MKLKNYEIKINSPGLIYLITLAFACIAMCRFCYSTDLYDKVEQGIFSVLLVICAMWIQNLAKITIEKVKKNEWGEDDTKLES